MEEDYDMVPHKEILKLKKEVEELKRSPGLEIKEAMQELTDSMNKMNEILKEATKEMKAEESEASKLNKMFDSLIDKLTVIIDENKTIAESMITLAELIKVRFPMPTQSQQPQRPMPRTPFQRTAPPSTPPAYTRANIPSLGQVQGSPQSMPPPTYGKKLPLFPPETKYKKGLFGRLRK